MTQQQEPRSTPGRPASFREALAFWAQDRARNHEPLSLVTLLGLRLGQWLEHDRRRRLVVLRKMWRACYESWCGVVVGIELPASASIGPGLRLRHAGRGVVLHPDVRLGRDATVFHGVTIGIRAPGQHAVADVGDDVQLLTRCVVLGGVRIGDGAVIGAHAVVIDDVPPGGRVVAPRSRLLP